jgi:hypothetical protein
MASAYNASQAQQTRNAQIARQTIMELRQTANPACQTQTDRNATTALTEHTQATDNALTVFLIQQYQNASAQAETAIARQAQQERGLTARPVRQAARHQIAPAHQEK